MTAISDYLEDALLDHVLRSTAYGSPGTVYVALFLSPGVDDTGVFTNEVSDSGTAYGRLAVTFDAPSGGVTQNSGAITFTTATAAWGNVTHVAITDSATVGGGNVLFWGSLAAARQVNLGDTFSIPVGNLTVTLT